MSKVASRSPSDNFGETIRRMISDVAAALSSELVQRDDTAALVDRSAFTFIPARRWNALARSGAFGADARRVGRRWVAPRAAVLRYVAGCTSPVTPAGAALASDGGLAAELGLTVDTRGRRHCGGVR